MAKTTTIKVGERSDSKNGKPIGLMDIVHTTETVEINDSGDCIEVGGIPLKTVVSLMKRFPALGSVLLGGEKNIMQIVMSFPDATAAIIAAGWASARKEDATEEMEKAASFIPMEKQIDCLAKIGGQTITSGYGPFVAKVKKYLDHVSENGGKDQDMKSPQPSNISVAPQIQASGN